MLGDLARMKVMPDADLPFIVDLETQIVGKLRAPIDNQVQQGLTQVPPGIGGGMPPMPGGPGGPGGMPPMPMPPGGPGVNGVSTAPPMPSPDELRRVLGQ